MNAQAIPQILEATPALDTNGKVTWTLVNKVDGHSGGQDHYPASDVHWGTGETPFKITITDTNKTGVTFAPDAMWIQPAAKGCPKQKVYDTGGQISGYQHDITGRVITFKDANSNPVATSYMYTLNALRNGQPVTPLDPIISNGGCCPGTRNTSSSTIMLLAVALVAVLLLAYLGYRQFAKRPDTGAGPGSDIGE